MENAKQITIEIPNSIMDKLTAACECSYLKQNHHELILEYLKHSTRSTPTLSIAEERIEIQDDYEELIGSLDFDNL